MSSGIYHYKPGDEVPVEVVEDGGEELPDRGDFVKAVGETADNVQVAGLDDDGDLAVAQLLDVPTDDQGNAVEGAATAVMVKPVTWVPVDGGYSPSVGDEVSEGADGVREYDDAAHDVPMGQVFQTVVREFGIGDKIAIARYR